MTATIEITEAQLDANYDQSRNTCPECGRSIYHTTFNPEDVCATCEQIKQAILDVRAANVESGQHQPLCNMTVLRGYPDNLPLSTKRFCTCWPEPPLPVELECGVCSEPTTHRADNGEPLCPECDHALHMVKYRE